MSAAADRAIAIVGPGVVGTALGVRLRGAGREIRGIAGRTREAAERAAERIGEGTPMDAPGEAARSAPTVLLTVPDRTIESIAWEIAARGPLAPGTLVIHTSGYHASTALAPLAAAGAATASLHPLQSLATVDEALARLPGARCFIEGDEPERLRQLVEDLGGVPVPIETSAKPLYHAAAATASNLLVAVIDLSLAIAERAGLERTAMLEALLPLIEGSVRNVAAVGIPDALTGPIARGDVGTVAGHLEALTRSAPDLLPAYASLALQTVDVAWRKGGLAEPAREELTRMLENLDPPGDRE